MAQHRYTAEEIIPRLREAENGRLKRVVAEFGRNAEAPAELDRG